MAGVHEKTETERCSFDVERLKDDHIVTYDIKRNL